jgi:hypothetical protein
VCSVSVQLAMFIHRQLRNHTAPSNKIIVASLPHM